VWTFLGTGLLKIFELEISSSEERTGIWKATTFLRMNSLSQVWLWAVGEVHINHN
jgi:hypothetical protein